MKSLHMYPKLILYIPLALLFILGGCSGKSPKAYAQKFCGCSEALSKAAVQKKAGRIEASLYESIVQEHNKCMGEFAFIEGLESKKDTLDFYKQIIEHTCDNCPEISRNYFNHHCNTPSK